jgi:hypothetical protein
MENNYQLSSQTRDIAIEVVTKHAQSSRFKGIVEITKQNNNLG